jgi:DNA gyrase inhibitor GyrI
MNLTEEPEIVTWPETHYVFVEKVGPFMDTAQLAWQTLHAQLSKIMEHNQVTGFLSLYKIGPQVYRAGVSVAAAPVDLPEGFKYEVFDGGKYSRFVLVGPYSQLPAASGRVWQLASDQGIELRAGFAIENYVNNPSLVPEDQLITEILLPTE